MMKGTVTENEKETVEIAAVTETRSERGGGAAPESAGGDPEVVRRTIGSVAEKGVETRIKTKTRTKTRTRIKTRIRTETRTETASAGVAVGTASATGTVTGKRKKSEQREKPQKMLRLLLKTYKWVMVL